MGRDFIYNQDRFPVPKGRGPNGRRFCRVCKSELPPKSGNCSACPGDCMKTYRAGFWTWREVRYAVYRRDKRRCRICGRDLRKMGEWLRRVHWKLSLLESRELRRLLGIPRNRGIDSVWDVDHVNPVADHGPAESIDELRTLCIWCHKSVSAKYARSRAIARRRRRKPAKPRDPSARRSKTRKG